MQHRSINGKTHLAFWNGLVNNLQNKKSLSFISFDIFDFYPPITEKLLNRALDFASKCRQISKQERDIILHAKQSLLFCENTQWEKSSTWQWDHMTEQKRVSWWVATSSPSLQKIRSKHRTLPGQRFGSISMCTTRDRCVKPLVTTI